MTATERRTHDLAMEYTLQVHSDYNEELSDTGERVFVAHCFHTSTSSNLNDLKCKAFRLVGKGCAEITDETGCIVWDFCREYLDRE